MQFWSGASKHIDDVSAKAKLYGAYLCRVGHCS
jgi:hypothetical protein